MTTIAGRMMLQGSPLFRGLSPDALGRIGALMVQRPCRQGEIVFSQGDPGDALYGIVRGKVRVSAGDSDGREIFFNLLGPGAVFGEIALLDGGARTATVTVVSAGELLSLARAPFIALLERESRVALELLRLCGERLRWVSGLAEDATLLDVPARLARRLLLLADRHGEPDARGPLLRLSQEDCANFLGVSRQLVNQYLQEWKARGWVGLSRGVVVLHNREALTRLARPAAATGRTAAD